MNILSTHTAHVTIKWRGSEGQLNGQKPGVVPDSITYQYFIKNVINIFPIVGPIGGAIYCWFHNETPISRKNIHPYISFSKVFMNLNFFPNISFLCCISTTTTKMKNNISMTGMCQGYTGAHLKSSQWTKLAQFEQRNKVVFDYNLSISKYSWVCTDINYWINNWERLDKSSMEKNFKLCRHSAHGLDIVTSFQRGQCGKKGKESDFKVQKPDTPEPGDQDLHQ